MSDRLHAINDALSALLSEHGGKISDDDLNELTHHVEQSLFPAAHPRRCCGEVLYVDGSVRSCAEPWGEEHSHDDCRSTAISEGVHLAEVLYLGGEQLAQVNLREDLGVTQTGTGRHTVSVSVLEGDPDEGDLDWPVTHVAVRRGEAPLFTVQITLEDAVVFPESPDRDWKVYVVDRRVGR